MSGVSFSKGSLTRRAHLPTRSLSGDWTEAMPSLFQKQWSALLPTEAVLAEEN
jgi:hypothetical protein